MFWEKQILAVFSVVEGTAGIATSNMG